MIDGTSSLDEMKKKANKFSSFECIKKAVERFPWHTKERLGFGS